MDCANIVMANGMARKKIEVLEHSRNRTPRRSA